MAVAASLILGTGVIANGRLSLRINVRYSVRCIDLIRPVRSVIFIGWTTNIIFG